MIAEAEAPTEVVLVLLDPFGLVRDTTILRWDLALSPGSVEPCVPALLDSSDALTTSPPCGVSSVVPARSLALAFGVPRFTVDNVGDTALPRTFDTFGERFAALSLPMEGARCDVPVRLGAEEPLLLRVDTPLDDSSLCAPESGSAFGARYVTFSIPPQSRAVLLARSALVADGGGNAKLRLGRTCDRETPCEQEVAQVWDSSGAPGRMTVENFDGTAASAIVSVHQGGVGYEGNEIELTLSFECL